MHPIRNDDADARSFALRFSIPLWVGTDVWRAGPLGQATVERLIGQSVDRSLSSAEVSMVLSILSFARALAKVGFPKATRAELTMAMRAITAFVLDQPDVLATAVTLGDKPDLAHWSAPRLLHAVELIILQRIDIYLDSWADDLKDGGDAASVAKKFLDLKSRSRFSALRAPKPTSPLVRLHTA